MPTTVDKIRRALEKRGGIAENEMQALAEDFQAKVQAVNERLDQSVMLLRKGLRSEAIQRVEMTPNALDAAADLEFPEWDEWNEILQFMGIPLPAKLNQDYVAQINEAIIECLPLDALLGRHRRLAIAKAPLSARLRTLRQIARVDSSNSVWNDDVESWEKVRLGQIDAELKLALENEDARQLYQLHKELTGGPWRIVPSSRLIEQSSFAAEAHVRQNQEAELGKLAPRVCAAFEKRDETAVRSLRTQWQTARAKFNLSVPKQLESSVAPAMQWLEDLDRQAVMESERQMAIANLEAKLAAKSSIDEVQGAYDQASRFGEPMPQELSDQVQEISSKPARAAKRKFQLIGAAVGAIVIAMVVGGVMMMSASNKANSRQETIDQMQEYVAAEQYDQAISYYDAVLASQPEIAAIPKMIAFHASAKKAVDKLTLREQLFEKRIAAASTADPAMIDASLLPQLDELAVTPGELARVAELRRRKQEYIADETLRQSDEMIAKVAELQRTFSQLQARGSASGNIQAIKQLESKIARLPNQYRLRSDEALAKQATLRSLVSSTLRRMKDDSMVSGRRSDAINDLLGSRSLEQFSDKLREYSTQSIARTNFIEFQTVMDEEEDWLNVDRINRWLGTLAARLSNGVSSSEANGLIESAGSLNAIVTPNPALDSMPKFIPSMKEIVGRRVILDGVFTLISKHPLSRVVTLPIDSTGGSTATTQYLMYKTYAEQHADQMKRSGSIGVEVVSDELGGVRNRAFPGPLPTIDEEPMKSVLQIIDQKTKQAVSFDQKWEQAFLLQVSEIMVKRKDLDGVVKEWLIFHLLEAGARGSEQLMSLIPMTMRALERRNSVREKWYEPRSKDTELNSELQRLIKVELQIAYKRLASPMANYEKIAGQRLKWVGFLSKTKSGQIEYHLRDAIPEYDGTLYVAVPAPKGGAETSLFPVGHLKQGHINLIPNPVHQVPGRPLFLFPN